MSGHDDTPDYLKGVDQPGFDDRDNFTVKSSHEGPLGARGYNKYVYDDDDDITDEREPLRIPWPLILLVVIVMGAIGTLVVAGVVASGTWVAGVERDALAEAGEIARVVDEERKIMDELGAHGIDKSQLEALFQSIDPEEGHARGFAALRFTHAVDEEVAHIGDIRGTSAADRHKKLAFAQKSYEEKLAAWESAAGNPIGALAIGVGLANAPPDGMP